MILLGFTRLNVFQYRAMFVARPDWFNKHHILFTFTSEKDFHLEARILR